jgi:hypothetical protein
MELLQYDGGLGGLQNREYLANTHTLPKLKISG